MISTIQTNLRRNANEILKFWFGSTYPSSFESRQIWFKKDAEFDEEIRQKFGQLVGDMIHYNRNDILSMLHDNEPHVKLASILCLDQFTRNIYRNEPNSFAGDSIASTFVIETLDFHKESILRFHALEQCFFYLPLMHSEEKESRVLAQKVYEDLKERCEPPFQSMVAQFLLFEQSHKVIIDQFGRYPHRNDILGRESTDEEIAFLQQPNSSF